MRRWFPRPAEPAAIRTLEPAGDLDQLALFELLTTDGQEWPHKVGVAGRAEGSGKPSTRLLANRGWVLKTDLARGADSWEQAFTALARGRELALRARVSHPSKHWAILRIGEVFYPLTACRELTTLRGLTELEPRLGGWLDMLRLALRVAHEAGLGLDLNPANFGRALGDARLYYLDDELYPSFCAQQLASSVVARIPEEPQVEPERWRQLGQSVIALLADEPRLREEVLAGFSDYPLSEPFESARRALVEGARPKAPTARGKPRPEVICVLADVHANLPALEAVLARAAELGASRYLFLGDAVGYGPHPKQCIGRLAELRDAVLLRGNHDHFIAGGQPELAMNGLARACAEWTLTQLSAAERTWLAALPLEHREGEWLALHGAPRDPRRLLAYVYELTYEDNFSWLSEHGPRLCFHGHSHVQTIYADLAGGRRGLRAMSSQELRAAGALLINPGSVGQPRDHDPRAAFGLFEPHHLRWTPVRVAYDLERTVHDLEREGLPPHAGQRLARGV